MIDGEKGWCKGPEVRAVVAAIDSEKGWCKGPEVRAVVAVIDSEKGNHRWATRNRKSYALYRMVTLRVTLSDPTLPQTTPICTFCTAIHIFVAAARRGFKFGT